VELPVNDDIAALIDAQAGSGAPPMHAGTPAAARAMYRLTTVGSRAPESVVPVRSVEERAVPGAAGELAARVYRPVATEPTATIAFFHGGGFVIGDLDTHDNMARTLCRSTGCVVVSIDYRLAPEHPFPAAVDDAVAAVEWLATHWDEFGGDGRIAVAGDSAGANLAAVAALHMRDKDTKALAAQLLIYPALDSDGSYPSRIENGSGYFLESAGIDWFAGHYLPDPTSRSDPRASPLRAADLSGLPSTVIATAEFDPLRDEGEAYAEALRRAGVPVVLERCAGLTHGFFDMADTAPSTRPHVDKVCALFAAVLDAARPDHVFHTT
jgi:acetyl esterase